jgi:two-component system chemotaxis sensor kinase CheA
VEVRTEEGKGTAVELAVPLSLAAFEALTVTAGGVAASIPLDAVRRAVRLSREEIVRTAEGESVVFEGRAVPFLSLPGALAGAARSKPRSSPWTAVVVEGEGGLAAVGVDGLAGTAGVVLRPLPDLAPCAELVAGASLDAEGNPQLVLDPDGLVAEARRAGAPAVEPESRPLPFLVIDDSLTTRMLEQSILESAGYQVDLARSGEEALAAARRTRYALFLVDVEMPGMDGFTFIERTRADPALADIPAILITSRASAEDRRRGQEVGAQGYIAKSEFDQAELLGRIRSLVG